jgi:membrane protease YdiL (CAAX protease family)
VVATIAVSVVYASVFNSTNGSLVAVMLLHGANNESWKFVLKDLFPGIDLGGDVAENVLVGVLWIAVALILVIVFGPEDLSNKPRQVVEDISHATDPEAQKKAEQ